MGCLPESLDEVLDRDRRGDMGMDEPSEGIAAAISGNRDVRLKLDRWAVMPEELVMGMGGMSGSKGKLAWANSTGGGGERMEPTRSLSGAARDWSAAGMVHIRSEKWWSGE